MKGGIGNLLKQAQKMQEELARTQERLAQEEVVGESGGGMVRVTMNGRHEVKRVEIDPPSWETTGRCWRIWWPPPATPPPSGWRSGCSRTWPDLTAGMPLPPGFKLPF
jgi:nucleoid-associated protein EbfC